MIFFFHLNCKCGENCQSLVSCFLSMISPSLLLCDITTDKFVNKKSFYSVVFCPKALMVKAST